MAESSAGTRQLIRRVLADPSQYPDEMRSWIQRLIPGNPLIQLATSQLPSVEKKRYVGADSTQPAFSHGANFGGAEELVHFYRDPFFIVHLGGMVGPTYAAGNVIFVLPTGYRPIKTETFIVLTDTGVGRVDIDASGNVTFASGGTGFVSLAGITFRPL